MLRFVPVVVPGGDWHKDVCILSQMLPLQVRHEPRYHKQVGATGGAIQPSLKTSMIV